MAKKPMRWTPEKIRDLRRRYGETQDDFRLRLGVTVTSLAGWEQGRGRPTGSAQLLLDRLEEDLARSTKRK